MEDVGPIQAKGEKRRAKRYLCKFFHEMTEISNLLSFAYRSALAIMKILSFSNGAGSQNG
jgi:hypothetical protein